MQPVDCIEDATRLLMLAREMIISKKQHSTPFVH